MKTSDQKCNRIIGLDMHPDVFAAAALENTDAAVAKTLWVQDRLEVPQLERWARKHLQPGDVLVLEASGNSFEIASRLHALGHSALVLESAQAGKIRHNFCNDDRHSAVKLARPAWARLWRLMGIRHRVAFALMAILGDIHRFPAAKKLVGYLGLSPRRQQSGNDAKGKERGLGRGSRGDLRCLLLQSAHNALAQRGSPLHQWGWKLLLKKNRNMAAAAVARKLTVAIWHLLRGHFTPLLELNDHLQIKLLRLATLLGKPLLKQLGYPDRISFVEHTFLKIQLST